VERIEELEKLGDTFEKPSDFSVETYLESSFGLVKEEPFDIEVLFKPDVASYVRSRLWHPSQEVREVGGGEIVMHLHVGGEFELGAWILSFGPSAIVLSPEKLRRRVESDLARTLENYRVEVTVAPSRSKSKRKPRKTQGASKR
jgi:predicted DNA-binding transcriptional regulator YafY